MLPSQNLAHVLVAPDNECTLCFPIKLLVGKQIVETTALIDSGVMDNFIDLGLLSLANFPLTKLPTAIQVYNVNGSTNKKGTILCKTTTRMLLSKESKDIKLMIVGLGRHQVILGMPWLKTWNLHIDWKTHSLSYPSITPPNYDDHVLPQQYLLHWLGLDVDQELSTLVS